jgi:hypothetical protein
VYTTLVVLTKVGVANYRDLQGIMAESLGTPFEHDSFIISQPRLLFAVPHEIHALPRVTAPFGAHGKDRICSKRVKKALVVYLIYILACRYMTAVGQVRCGQAAILP